MKYKIFIILVLLALATPHILNGNVTLGDTCIEIEIIGLVVKIVDGDTIDVKVLGTYKDVFIGLTDHVIRIRFADIDAPEIYTPECIRAKAALAHLLKPGETIVYLDVDDLSITDKYGRYIALVYVKYNKTTLLNVNKWLVDEGYAVVKDFLDNEFNPYTWTLYVQCFNETTFTDTIQLPMHVIRENEQEENPVIFIITALLLFTVGIITYRIMSKY